MDKELIRTAERSHYIMQLSSYFTELTDLPGIRFAYTNKLSDAWYNQAYDFRCKSDECDVTINRMEKYFSSRDRLPIVYLTEASSPKEIGELLKGKGYASFDQEAWMFYDFNQPIITNTNNSIDIINVNNEEELSLFAEVYRKGLPGPEVEKYIESVVDGFRSMPPLVSINYFLAYMQGQPAGMASVLNHGVFAGVYAVATIPEFQRQGCAKALTSKVIETARSKGAQHIFLQTGAGDESEVTFNKLGFRTEFVREGFTHEEAIDGMEHG